MDVFVVVVRRQNEHACRGKLLDDLARGLEPAQHGHGDIHKYDIRPQSEGQLHSLPPRLSLPDDFYVPLCLQQGAEPPAHDGMIVTAQYTHSPPTTSHTQ